MYVSTSDLLNGITQLYGGTVDLKDGTGTFKDKTTNLNSDVSKQIDDVLSKLTGDNSAPVSFISSKNTNVKSVQFVLKTDAIAVHSTAAPAASVAKTLTPWQRFLKLFGLYKG